MKKYLFLFFLLITSITTCLSQTRYYVSATGMPTGNALSWQTACNDLQLVINNAAPYDTIWVAQGTYVPIRPADRLNIIDSNCRANAFVINKPLYVYGGFTGTETELSQRSFPAQGSNGLSILSGDIGVSGINTDNVCHVVLLISLYDTIVLDGFTVTKGYAAAGIGASHLWDTLMVNGVFVSNQYYGGIYNLSDYAHISHVSVTENDYGGIGSENSSILLSDAIVSYNTGNSPAIDINISRSPKICTISIENTTSSNNAYFGLGCRIDNDSMTNVKKFLSLSHVYLTDNGRSGVNGGGCFLNIIGDVCTALFHVYMENNQATWGGGCKLYSSSVSIPPLITFDHVYITGNTAGYGGGCHVVASHSNIFFSNIYVANNTASYTGGMDIGLSEKASFFLTNAAVVNNEGYIGGVKYSENTLGNTNSLFVASNITIANNKGRSNRIGGFHQDSKSPSYIRNSIIWGNQVYSSISAGMVEKNIQSNNTSFSNCLLGETCYEYIDTNDNYCLPFPPGTFHADPLFVDTANGDFRLQCGSPAVNMGNNAFYHPDSFPNLSHIIKDLDGNSRFFNQDIDLGAYELQEPCAPFIWVADTVFTCFKDSTEIHIRLSGTAPWDLVYTSNNGQSYDTLKNIWNNDYILKLYTTDTLRVSFPYIQDALFDNILSDTVFISIVQLPVLTSVMENDTLCSGEQTKAVVFEGIADNYQWEAKGDTINYIPNDVQTGDFGSYKVENTDTFPLSTTITVMPYVTVSNKTCYGKIDSFSITVRPVIQLEAGVNDSLFCEGDSILFVLFNTSVSDVVWQGNETILDEENAVIPDAKPAHSGMYVVRARKSNYCILPDTVQITVLSAIITDMDDTLYMCDWEDITIYSNATNADDYLWNTGETSTNINVSNPGTYYVEATNERCIVFDTVEVIQIQVSEFTISSSGNLCDGKDVELTATIDNVSYQWNTGDTTKTIIVSVEGFYSVTIEAGHCQAYKELEINCPCKIVLPNVFTPVQGRTYLPIVDFTLNSYSMHVYDRWGNIVFQTNSLSPWDGTNKGRPVSDGVYYCVVSYTCTDMPEKILTTQSSITVMR